MKKSSRTEARRLAAERAARKAKLQWAVVISVPVLIIGGLILFSVLEAIPQYGDVSSRGWDLPALDNDPNGDGRIALAEFAGQPVVLNFYADWCIACGRELPAFAAVEDAFGDRVHFVHVNSPETGSWQRLVDEFGTDDWPIARDINGTVANGSGLWQSLGGRGMPITAFYDSSGALVTVNNGAMNESRLRALLASEFGVG